MQHAPSSRDSEHEAPFDRKLRGRTSVWPRVDDGCSLRKPACFGVAGTSRGARRRQTNSGLIYRSRCAAGERLDGKGFANQHERVSMQPDVYTARRHRGAARVPERLVEHADRARRNPHARSHRCRRASRSTRRSTGSSPTTKPSAWSARSAAGLPVGVADGGGGPGRELFGPNPRSQPAIVDAADRLHQPARRSSPQRSCSSPASSAAATDDADRAAEGSGADASRVPAVPGPGGGGGGGGLRMKTPPPKAERKGDAHDQQPDARAQAAAAESGQRR